MIEKTTKQLVLDFFFDRPSYTPHLRELSRLLRLSMPTILATTSSLAKELFLIKTKGKAITTLAANRESPLFIRAKRIANLERMYQSGLVDRLSKSYGNPKAIILFGSFSRGEDAESSDIDIAVLTHKRQNENLTSYEKYFCRRISLP